MNKLNFLSKLAIAGVASVAALAVPMKANAGTFIIDDFNTGFFAQTPSCPYPVKNCNSLYKLLPFRGTIVGIEILSPLLVEE